MQSRQLKSTRRLITSALVASAVTLGGSIATVTFANSASDIADARKSLKNNQALTDLGRAFRDVANAVEPSVVHIEVQAKNNPRGNRRGFNLPPGFRLPPGMDEDMFRFFRGPRGMQPQQEEEEQPGDHQWDVPHPIGAGSGWVYDDQGHIITNNHVVEHADVIRVKFSDKTVYTAKVVGTDPATDIAVLQVEGPTLHPAVLAESPVEQGDIVFAFGSPLQYEFSMSQGIVSGKGRHMGLLGPTGYEDFIQTDAAINPGNSGGPLVDIHGQVVGMNTAIASRSGMFNGVGFAIPAAMIRNVVGQLIEHGKVSRGFLGVAIQDDSELIKSFGYDGAGVVISDVQKGMPGDKAGLKRGDIVIKVDGMSVTTSDELRSAIARVAPDHKTKLTIVRDGKQKEVDVKVASMPENIASASDDDGNRGLSRGEATVESLRKLGLGGVATLTKDVAEQAGIEFREGVLIKSVRSGSVAARAGLKPGLIITEVNGKAVADVDALTEAIGEDPVGKVYRLTVQTERGSSFVVLRM